MNAGCGTAPAAELPAPAGPPVSAPLTERPAGTVESNQTTANEFGVTEAEIVVDPTLDGARDRLLIGGRSTRTCHEPIASAEVERGKQIAVLCGRERVLDLY